MAWQIKDEWIDLAQGKHVVVYHNPDILVDAGGGSLTPQEHHLIHHFGVDACPHCGHVKESKDKRLKASVDGDKVKVDDPEVDFNQVKLAMLATLHGHHEKMMQYAAKHPNVRRGHGPKQ